VLNEGYFSFESYGVIRCVAILHTCCADTHRQKQAERIGYQTSLAPLYFLASVETTVPALRGIASRLGTQDCR
jgi:hypothetical protein